MKFYVNSVPLFIPNINLFSCELENFMFKALYIESFYIKVKNKIRIPLQFLVKNLKQFPLLF